MSENRFAKLLRLKDYKRSSNKTLANPNNSHEYLYTHINWNNANRAGLFNNNDIDELDRSLERLGKEGVVKSLKSLQPTIKTATREQLLLALHKKGL